MGYKFSRCGDGSCPCEEGCETGIACLTLDDCCFTAVESQDLRFTMSMSAISVLTGCTSVGSTQMTGTGPTYTGTVSGGRTITVTVGDRYLDGTYKRRITKIELKTSGGAAIATWDCHEQSEGVFTYLLTTECGGDCNIVPSTANFCCNEFPARSLKVPTFSSQTVDVTIAGLTDIVVTKTVLRHNSATGDPCNGNTAYLFDILSRVEPRSAANGTYTLDWVSSTVCGATYRKTFSAVYTGTSTFVTERWRTDPNSNCAANTPPCSCTSLGPCGSVQTDSDCYDQIVAGSSLVSLRDNGERLCSVALTITAVVRSCCGGTTLTVTSAASNGSVTTGTTGFDTPGCEMSIDNSTHNCFEFPIGCSLVPPYVEMSCSVTDCNDPECTDATTGGTLSIA